jgi:thymidylate synthase (FAD)
MLSDFGHESPIEHVCFTFLIEGVSRSLLAQITRHRIASFSVKSQRYVKEGQFEYIIPPEIEKIKRG